MSSQPNPQTPRSKVSRKLTAAQRRWCEHVNNGMNGTAAARLIWPNRSRPQDVAYLLRKEPHIQAYLEHLDAAAMEEAGVTRTVILRNLKAIADFDVRKLYKADGSLKAPHELDDETAAALASLEIEESAGDGPKSRTQKVRQWSKTEALRLLAQIRGMLAKEQLEISGPGGTPFTVELVRFTDGGKS